MNDGVLVVVDGRIKVLHRARGRVDGRDEELVRTVLDHRPELVVGAATRGDDRRLLLVGHRAVAPGTWLERLYVDSDAVPVLVGVQLAHHDGAAEDGLLRLLDRVALELPSRRGPPLRQLAHAVHGDRDEAELLVQALGRRVEPDAFWALAESRLAEHRVRVVLVAAHLPAELVRVIELLDEELRDVEVRGVEVAVHGSGQVRALVPRATCCTSSSRRAGDDRFLAVLDLEVGAPAAGRHRLQD